MVEIFDQMVMSGACCRLLCRTTSTDARTIDHGGKGLEGHKSTIYKLNEFVRKKLNFMDTAGMKYESIDSSF